MSANVTAAREAVAAEVRAVIAKRRVSQVRVAKALGISQQALSRRTTGELPFEVDVLFGIAKFLNVPIGELLPRGADEQFCMNSVALTFVAA